MPIASDLPYLIRLLDDEDPTVQPIVRNQLAEFGGDISQDLAALGLHINARGQKQLSHLLAPGRRETLRSEWLVPTGGAMALADDWESFESILRQISDFLHDGITLRPSLPDSLDLLIDDLYEELPTPTANELRRWLFLKGRFKGVTQNADAAVNYDLCHVIDTRLGNPTSLACLFMLLGCRVGAQVEGCNYPGHFLARIQIDGRAHLIDCFHAGKSFELEALIVEHPEISRRARASIEEASHLGTILLRYVTELQHTFTSLSRNEDAALFKELAQTLQT